MHWPPEVYTVTYNKCHQTYFAVYCKFCIFSNSPIISIFRMTRLFVWWTCSAPRNFRKSCTNQTKSLFLINLNLAGSAHQCTGLLRDELFIIRAVRVCMWWRGRGRVHSEGGDRRNERDVTPTTRTGFTLRAYISVYLSVHLSVCVSACQHPSLKLIL